MTRLRNRPPAVDVRVEIRGELSRADAEYARGQAVALLGGLGPESHAARLRVTQLRGRSMTRPAVAQATVETEDIGRIRVQLSAVTPQEAVDLALGTLLGRAARLREHGEIGLAAVYESAYRPQFASRPLAERSIARRKPVVLARRTPDDAVREMVALDHHFHLFEDAVTGQDSLVHRRPAVAGFRLVRADSSVRLGGTRLPLVDSLHPAPRLDPYEAARRLWLTCWPFVFHVDPGDGRGRVLYRRYDGNYGLITPVAGGAATTPAPAGGG